MVEEPATIRRARRRELEERIGALAKTQHGIVTRAQLLDAGLLAGAIRRRLDAGRLRLLHRGVYAAGPLLPPRAREMAAVLACGPEAVLSHRSAAVVLGLVPPLDSGSVDVLVPLPYDRTRPGIRVRRSGRLSDDERTRHEGIPITSALRTIVDLAGVAGVHELERAMARAEREGLVARAQLLGIGERYRGCAGIQRLRAILERAGGPSLTRSEAETRLLALVRRARLPAPETNVTIGEYEIDFLWRENGLAVEVDGSDSTRHVLASKPIVDAPPGSPRRGSRSFRLPGARSSRMKWRRPYSSGRH